MPSPVERLVQHRRSNRLSYRLLMYIIACSTLLAILSTGAQLLWDYRKDVNTIEQGIASIEASYLDSLASSLWKLDKDQIAIQLDGIMKLPDIAHAAITEVVAGKEEQVFVRGDNRRTDLPIQEQFDLYYRDTLVGRLSIGATLDHVYTRLLERFFIILGTQAIKTFLVSICILTIVHYMIVRHLAALSRYTQRLDLYNLDEDLELQSNALRSNKPDELSQLATTINQMRANIGRQLDEKRKAKEALQSLNEELEQRVKYRTATLKHTNERLSSAIAELTDTKDRLVESQKMAALGELVSGVSKQLDRPLSDARSSLQLLLELNQQLTQGTLNPDDADRIVQQGQELERLQRDLTLTDELIRSFKSLAINQRHELSQRMRLKRVVEQSLTHHAEELRARNCNLIVNCSDSLELVSYPRAWEQMLDILIENSLRHGIAHTAQPEIRIEASSQEGELCFSFADNGIGVPEPILPKIFDPFVTGSASGGSGLGTHIVYNLVTRLLKGRISCHSTRGQGTQFEITVPQRPLALPTDELP